MVSQSENIARPSSSLPFFSVLKVRPQNGAEHTAGV